MLQLYCALSILAVDKANRNELKPGLKKALISTQVCMEFDWDSIKTSYTTATFFQWNSIQHTKWEYVATLLHSTYSGSGQSKQE